MWQRRLLSLCSTLLVLAATPAPHHRTAVKHYSAVHKLKLSTCSAKNQPGAPTAPHGATVTTNGKTITTVQNRGTAVTRTSVCKP